MSTKEKMLRGRDLIHTPLMGGVERRQIDHTSRDSSLVFEFDFMEQENS